MGESGQYLQREIFSLIANRQKIRLKDISPEKSLNFDLGVDGDEAVVLILAYSGQFHVDIEPLGAEWDRYFRSEPNLLTPFQTILSFLTRKPDPRRPLPISGLVAAARTGKWVASPAD